MDLYTRKKQVKRIRDLKIQKLGGYEEIKNIVTFKEILIYPQSLRTRIT